MKKFFHKYAIWSVDIKSQMSLIVLSFVLMKPIVDGLLAKLIISGWISEEAGMLYALAILAFNVFNMRAITYGIKIKEAGKEGL